MACGVICTCYDFTCTCGARYRYDAFHYHWPTTDNLCMECDETLPSLICQERVAC
jgi:hypothetical protein